jgi:hypothetical protein
MDRRVGEGRVVAEEDILVEAGRRGAVVVVEGGDITEGKISRQSRVYSLQFGRKERLPQEKWGEFRSSTAEKEEETEREDERKKTEGNKERGTGWDAGVGRREEASEWRWRRRLRPYL